MVEAVLWLSMIAVAAGAVALVIVMFAGMP